MKMRGPVVTVFLFAISLSPLLQAQPPGRHVRRITLEEAKAQAAATSNPLVRLGELQVEAAKQHRLGTQSDFFPKISSLLTNFHFNKFMGEEITVTRPIAGGTVTAQLPLVGKDQTLIAATVAQPVTPLFKLKQVYNIARADENIARANAGMPVSQASALIEKNYYELLVAQRQLEYSQANSKVLENKLLLASDSPDSALPAHDEQLVEIAKALATATSRVEELTASLNQRLGFPADTELELVPPMPLFEDISLKEATDKAMDSNAEVVEAEQNVVKAHAASRLSKLDYVPDIVVMGGYAYNGNAIPLLPRDFSFIGIMGSYNLFDFGKREHTIKERNAQVGMAEVALELTKAKVAAKVQSSYFELQRFQQLSQLTRRLADAIQVQRVDYKTGPSLAAKKARFEAEMYQSDLDYLQAIARLKALMGEE